MYETNVNTAEGAWSPTGWPGVSMKVLQQGASAGGMTGMLRMDPGSSIPAHSHTHADQSVFVLEGDLTDEGTSYRPGTFLVAKAGTRHGPHSSTGGCILLSTYFGPPDFVPAG